MRSLILAAILLVAGCAPSQSQNATEIADNLDATADNLGVAAENVSGATQNQTDDSVAEVNDATGASTDSWQYKESHDEMRGGTRKIASLAANDVIHLGSPYGDTTPELNIRRDPKFGFDIYITSDGQPLCPFQEEHVSVKFDDGPVREWGCAEASDGSPGIVFFNGESSLLDHLKNSKKMMVEIQYYDAGRQQITFPVAGLKW